MFRQSKSVLFLAAAVSMVLLATMRVAHAGPSNCNPACDGATECCVAPMGMGFGGFDPDGSTEPSYSCVKKPTEGEMCGALSPCVGSDEGDVCAAGLKCHAATKECVKLEVDDTCTPCGAPYGSKGPCCGSGVRGHNNECFCYGGQ
ncbi:hypothetical protein EC991_001585 [Linnemannia zychae]|nr:hypothetical protein EC991_001585 [Linnemannia zychae]